MTGDVIRYNLVAPALNSVNAPSGVEVIIQSAHRYSCRAQKSSCRVTTFLWERLQKVVLMIYGGLLELIHCWCSWWYFQDWKFHYCIQCSVLTHEMAKNAKTWMPWLSFQLFSCKALIDGDIKLKASRARVLWHLSKNQDKIMHQRLASRTPDPS